MSNFLDFLDIDIGCAPEREVSGDQVRFKNPDNSWGEWIDLKGEIGPKGEMGDKGLTGPKGDRIIQTCSTCKSNNCNCGDS